MILSRNGDVASGLNFRLFAQTPLLACCLVVSHWSNQDQSCNGNWIQWPLLSRGGGVGILAILVRRLAVPTSVPLGVGKWAASAFHAFISLLDQTGRYLLQTSTLTSPKWWTVTGIESQINSSLPCIASHPWVWSWKQKQSQSLGCGKDSQLQQKSLGLQHVTERSLWIISDKPCVTQMNLQGGGHMCCGNHKKL